MYLYYYTSTTERHGRVVNTPASYSGGPRVQISTRRPAIVTEAFRGSYQYLLANAGTVH
jgi:hypothetical protein